MGFALKSGFCVLVVAVLGMFPSAFAALPLPGTLEKLPVNVKSLGEKFDPTVAPGPDDKQYLYVNYLNFNNTLDLVRIDLNSIVDNGPGGKTFDTKVFDNPTGETGARTMVLGTDGNLYLGTSPHAHILKLNTKEEEEEAFEDFLDLSGGTSPPVCGAPVTIWQLAFGADGNLYAATSPNSALIRIDTNPDSPGFENLGTMDPDPIKGCASKRPMARTIAPGTGADAKYMYIGLGAEKAGIAAYDTSTGGKQRVTLPKNFEDIPGTIDVWQADDGVYGSIASPSPTNELGADCHLLPNGKMPSTQYFKITGTEATKKCAGGWKATPKTYRDGRTIITLSGGGTITLDNNGMLTTATPKGTEGPYKIDYEGREPKIFSLGIGPDHVIYGSTALPAKLIKFEGSALSEIGPIGDGEAYSFATLADKLYMGIYSGDYPLSAYTPPSLAAPSGTLDGFPPACNYKGKDYDYDKCLLDATWRPFAMVADPDGKLYTGGTGGYGKLVGTFAVYTPGLENPKVYNTDQSITTLATWTGTGTGRLRLFGGTSIYGDSTNPKNHADPPAFLFEVDPANGTVERKATFAWDTTIPLDKDKRNTATIEGTKIDSLVVTGAGTAYGIAFGSATPDDLENARLNRVSLFVVDLSKGPNDQPVTSLPFLGNTNNSMALGLDDHIWGVANTSPRSGGIFKINTKTRKATWVLRPREPITRDPDTQDPIIGDAVYFEGGFVLDGNQIYASAGADLWCYTIPYKVGPDLLWRNPSDGTVSIGLMDPHTLAMSSSAVLGNPPSMNSDWELSGAADFTGDGKNDILWHNTKTGKTSIWIMNGNEYVGTVPLEFPAEEVPPGYETSEAQNWKLKFTADFNGDGMPDILWRSDAGKDAGKVVIWLMNGVKRLSKGTPGTRSLDWELVGPADFDQDNKADLLWRNTKAGQTDAGKVAIWLLDGTTMRSTNSPGLAMLDNSLVGTGDFNGDSSPDLVFRNTKTGQVSIWLMAGADFKYSTSPRSANLAPASANLGWDLAAVTDFDGDGSSDLLWQNNGKIDVKLSGKLSVWRMNGTALSSSTVPGIKDYSVWKLSAVADFDSR